ncbi:MAG: hypothetical protein ACTSPL_03315 [Candidatus Odinarchaeia archaeon]
MKCEFEEKIYEFYHNLELVDRERIIFPPGQVMEHDLGIDVALFSWNKKFWRIWGFKTSRAIPTGIGWWPLLNEHQWEKLEAVINTFSDFKFNIFLQYKRPKYITSIRGREYRWWGKPYFRYELLEHQQNILEQLELNARRNAIVAYASPAFYKWKDLSRYFEENRLIENSNYVKPDMLKRHRRWTYINSGTLGKAFSEPRDIENIFLLKEIRRIRGEISNVKHISNSEFIAKTSNQIVASLRETKNYWPIFSKRIERLPLPRHSLGRNLVKIYIFLFITRIRWGIGI